MYYRSRYLCRGGYPFDDPAAIRARDVMLRTVATVTENEDIRVALATIKDRRVRRPPVVDKQQRLVGVISLNDLVAKAERRRDAEIPREEFLRGDESHLRASRHCSRSDDARVFWSAFSFVRDLRPAVVRSGLPCLDLLRQ